ncbi:hypothetical protein V8J88_10890 [Massilia sp. W12]|uniref:hypothetical protein n=1 Tax=Massilia sp. W12 TaxID=3126507 RepID=UPI0030CB0EBD
MNPHPLFAIAGCGAHSAAGSSAGQSAASLQAQSRCTQRRATPWQAEAVSLAPCPSLDKQSSGAQRLLDLLAPALAEALPPALQMEIRQTAARAGGTDMQVYALLLLPDWLAPEHSAEMHTIWLDCLRASLPGLHISAHCLQRGAIAPWEALQFCQQQTQQHPRTAYTILAGVDSWCEPSRIGFAVHHHLLLCKGNQEGFIGGEAGAAVVLQTVARDIQGQRLGWPAPQAGRFLLHPAAADYASHGFWPHGNASQRAAGMRQLRHTLAQALAQAGMQAQHLSHLASDMDGSVWRAEIEGDALNQVLTQGQGAAHSRPPHLQIAGMLGQTGCAGGLLLWSMLPHLQRLQNINSVLHWTLAPGGQSAACVIERVTGSD